MVGSGRSVFTGNDANRTGGLTEFSIIFNHDWHRLAILRAQGMGMCIYIIIKLKINSPIHMD